MSRLPAVDIVIAARNEQKHLGSCLNALASQNYPKELTQVWLVDNSDDDATIRVAQNYNVQIIKCDIARASIARNIGIRQGNAELVAFLDAHCVPHKNWLSNMVPFFEDERTGGCQGTIEFKYDSSLLGLLFGNQSSAKQAQKRILLGLRGKISAYPFVITGNSMFRRQALEQVACFDEKLAYLEDIDLSWKIVLLGYALVFAKEASVLHITPHSSLSYLKKVFGEGIAGAQLTHRYKTGQTHINDNFFTAGIPLLPVELTRFLGFCLESAKLSRQSEGSPEEHIYTPVAEYFRLPFCWTTDKQLNLSPQIVFWYSESNESIIMHTGRNTRYVMEGTANSFFRELINGSSRDATLSKMVQHYNISPEVLSQDLDTFIANLIEEGIAICKKKLPASQQHALNT